MTTLGRIASRESTTGIVQSFKLTRESVYRALEGGMTPAAIESFLTARSRNGVPANVSHSLSEWSRKRDALVVRRSVALGANWPEGHEAVRGRVVGTRFVVASTRAATKVAEDLRLTAESKTPVRNWKVDEHGAVFPGEPVSLIGKARLRRFASFSDGSWRITPESIRAARDLGIPADQVLAWLGAHLGHEVPPVLASAIRNWAGGREKVFFGDVVLIQVSDPKAFEALRRSARLQPFLKGVLAPGCLVVAANMRKDAGKTSRRVWVRARRALQARIGGRGGRRRAHLPGKSRRPQKARKGSHTPPTIASRFWVSLRPTAATLTGSVTSAFSIPCCGSGGSSGGAVSGSFSQDQRSRHTNTFIRSSATRFDSDQPKVAFSCRYFRSSRAISAVQI